MVLRIVDFYHTLIWSPLPIFSIWSFLAETVALLLPCVLFCWIIAVVISRAFLDRKEELTTYVRARMAWSWAAAVGLLLLLIYVGTLGYFERVVTISAVLPYYAAAFSLALIAAIRLLSLKRELKHWQQIVS